MADKRSSIPSKKARYLKKSYKKLYIEPGQCGFLATCNFREKDCIREAYNILNQYADEMYGVATATTDISENEKKGNEEQDETDDISSQLMNEIQIVKTDRNVSHVRKRFQAVETGASNILFISTTIPNPVKLAMSIICDIANTKKQETRFLIRLVPIEKVCRANMKDIIDTAGQLMDRYFIKDPKTFAIVFNRRCNESLDRTEVIKELADLVGQKNPLNKADLKNADLYVIVEIIKGLCLMSIVPDYLKFKKFNLLELSQKTTLAADVSSNSAEEISTNNETTHSQ